MLEDSVKFIEGIIAGFKPEIGIILGSGLGEIADEHCDKSILYSEIPDFTASTVIGHKGRLVFAKIHNKNVVMMQGRNHFYEGYSLQQITYPVKVLKKLGIKTIILTNAAGAVNENYLPSDLMIISDHINFMGSNPLIGTNDEELGTRFPDMSKVYKKDLRELAHSCAKDLGFSVQEGVYLANSGPSYETPAEVKMARILGADAVGMSTVPEAIVANYCGLDVLGISCICNSASSIGGNKLSHQEVIENANKAKIKFKSLVLEIISRL